MNAINVNNNEAKVERTICEIYTRVMGYHRPVSSFNIGKKSEFYSRTYFKQCDNSVLVNSNLDFSNKYCG